MTSTHNASVRLLDAGESNARAAPLDSVSEHDESLLQQAELAAILSVQQPKRLYAVKQSHKLQQPALFFAWSDCEPFVEEDDDDNNLEEDDDGGVEYASFDTLAKAIRYLFTTSSPAEDNSKQPDATDTHRDQEPTTSKRGWHQSPRQKTTRRNPKDSATIQAAAKGDAARPSGEFDAAQVELSKETKKASNGSNPTPSSLHASVGLTRGRKRKPAVDPDAFVHASDADPAIRHAIKSKLLGHGATPRPDRRCKLGVRSGKPSAKHQAKWEAKVHDLLLFQKQHGHMNVPCKYPPNRPLAKWVSHQRTHHRYVRQGKPSNLTPERIRQLTDLGFAWKVSNVEPVGWEERIGQLQVYKDKHGHCNVPQYCKEEGIHPTLGSWVTEVRRHRKKNTGHDILLPHRIEELNNMGFQWQLRKRNPKEEPPPMLLPLPVPTEDARDGNKEQPDHSLTQQGRSPDADVAGNDGGVGHGVEHNDNEPHDERYGTM